MIKILFAFGPLYSGPGLLKLLLSTSGLSLIFVRPGLLLLFSSSLDEMAVLPKCRRIPRMALDNVCLKQDIEVETELLWKSCLFLFPHCHRTTQASSSSRCLPLPIHTTTQPLFQPMNLIPCCHSTYFLEQRSQNLTHYVPHPLIAHVHVHGSGPQLHTSHLFLFLTP